MYKVNLTLRLDCTVSNGSEFIGKILRAFTGPSKLEMQLAPCSEWVGSAAVKVKNRGYIVGRLPRQYLGPYTRAHSLGNDAKHVFPPPGQRCKACPPTVPAAIGDQPVYRLSFGNGLEPAA